MAQQTDPMETWPVQRRFGAVLGPLDDVNDIQDFNLADLRLTLSPRFGTRDRDHVRALAECFDQLPPILVYEPSNEVVDGIHRVMAARQLGLATIRGRVLQGPEDEAYIAGVSANIAHGKPLTVAERRAAARRILASHPEWSDRRIGMLCGLSSQTVAGQRQALGTEQVQPAVRIGKDGRARPADPSVARLRVAKLVEAEPDAPLRDLARRAGTSQATVLDVKRRIHRGESPLPHRLQAEAASKPAASEPVKDQAMLSMSETAAFVEWFERHRIVEDITVGIAERVACVPKSRVYVLADEAARQSRMWAELAAALERRSRQR